MGFAVKTWITTNIYSAQIGELLKLIRAHTTKIVTVIIQKWTQSALANCGTALNAGHVQLKRLYIFRPLQFVWADEVGKKHANKRRQPKSFITSTFQECIKQQQIHLKIQIISQVVVT